MATALPRKCCVLSFDMLFARVHGACTGTEGRGPTAHGLRKERPDPAPAALKAPSKSSLTGGELGGSSVHTHTAAAILEYQLRILTPNQT